MKNPIKNGKEVFAVLSMATVMSISMSVKVDAASNAANNEDTKNIVIEAAQNMDRSSSSNDGVDTTAAKETAKSEDNKEALVEENKATDPGSHEVTGEASEAKAEEAASKVTGDEKAETPQNKAAEENTPVGKAEDDKELELSEEKSPESVKEGQEQSTEPNYAEDEANIKNFDESERYRSTQMEQGAGPTASFDNLDKENEFVDGYRYKTLEPSPTSPDKTKWGFEIEIDKEKGQRTYTDFAFTNSGLMGGVLSTGNIPAKSPDDGSLGDSFKTPNYKATTEIEINGSGKQRNLNAIASEEDLKRINNINNKNTTMAWEGHYKVEDPKGPRATTGSSAGFTFTVNPWPNENDKLKIIKLNGSHDQKEFVQGQLIDTGVKVENLDDNAKERLVGQVYNPKTGKVVPGAKAYIDENGNVKVQMPEGAVDKNGNINKNSIFTQDEYKGIQNLEVKFFARPRTEAEFRAVGVKANYGEDKYTPTGAGTKTINHNGKNVVIDKQGIDRYDHYNLIGKFNINLDDTRYYDQDFYNGKNEKTGGHTFNDVKAGEAYEIKGIGSKAKEEYKLTIDGENPKTAEEMQDAVDKGEASVEIDQNFINTQNAKLNPDNRWIVEPSKEGGASNFTIIPPKTSEPGDHFSFPVTYTYTNGSTDVHWFHFVVQKSDNNAPKYRAKAGFEGTTITSKPKLAESKEGVPDPQEYILEKTTYKDEKGNEWTVSVDETGAVTATIPEGNIEGGESIEVPVKVKYIDKNNQVKYEYNKVEFFAMPKEDAPKYKTQTKDEKKSDIPFETIVEYDENLDEGTFKEIQAGVKGELSISFVQDTLNDKKGIFQEDGSFKEGESKIEAKVTKEPTPRIIKVGTKPAETTVKIPKGLEYELDYTRKDGKPEVVEEGNDGVITVITKRDPKTGVITMEQNVTTEAKNKKIKIPAGTEGTHEYTEKKPFTYDVQFDPDFYKNYPDAKDNYKIVTEGKVGEKTTKWTIKNSEIVGEPGIIKDTDPTNAVIKVGQKDYTGTITHTESHEVPFEVEYKYSNELEAGQTKVEQKGEKGSYDVEYSQKIKNGEKDGELTSTKKNEKAAKKEIIVIGTKPVTKVVEKPFNTEYVYDENLESGKTEEVTPGKNGKVTITTSYDKDQKKVVTSETEEAGQNRVVKIGGKTNGTEKVKEEIPFEVEVRKDPSLKKGEWKYATDDKGNELKGEKGEQEKTLTIVNSKVTETSDPTVTKKAKNAVVLVGEETNDGTHEIKEKKELPFETKIVYDESLEAGQREETGGEPGEQERTNTLVIKDGKVTETKEGEFKTTKDPVDKVIKIGIKPIVKEVEKPFETEYIYDENVEMGKEEEVTPGEKGKVTITTSYDKDQNKLVTKEETKDPVKRVVKVGTKPVTKVVEKPFNTEYQYDENLEAGKTEEVTPGKNGKVTITTSYDETQKKIVTSETEEAGQNRVVKIGGKTKGTIEILDKLAYEVEVIKDDTLDAGTFKTVQEGIDGEKKTTLTIENSKEIKGSRKEEITKQPVKKIIKVGTKPTENMCPVPEGPRTPDDNGPNKPGTPGVTPNRPNEPGTPGDNTQSKPGKNTTNKPVENTPSEPGKKTPNKPGENPSEDPKNPPQEAPEKPKLEKENDPKLSEIEKVKEAEKAKEADEEIETEEAKVLNQVKKEGDEEASRVGNEVGKANLAGDDKAPKTGDAGLMAETASAGLASGLLLLLGRFKRKKEDEE